MCYSMCVQSRHDSRTGIRGLRVWFVLAIGAALVYGAFVLETDRSLVFRVPVVDAASYHNQAIARVAGEAPAKPFWQPPLYIYWLTFIYRFVSTDILAVRLIQGAFFVLTVLFTFAIAQRLCSLRDSLIAAIVVMLYGPILFFSSQLLPTGMAVAADMGVVLCWLRLSERPSLKRALAAGAVTGVATLTVANILIVVPLVLAWMAIRMRRDRRFTFWAKVAAIYTAGVISCIVPVTIRNYVVTGQFVPISTNAGINLYIGNNPDADETVQIRPGITWDRLTAWPYREGACNESGAERFFIRKVVGYVREQPLRFVRGLAHKGVRLLSGREIPRNVDIYAFRSHSRMLQVLVWCLGSFCFPFGLVAPLALWGMARVGFVNRESRILLATVSAYIASIVLFFPSSRYLAPMLPALVIFAVFGVARLFKKSVPWSERACGWISCIALLALLNLPIGYSADGVDYDAELHMYVGVGLQKRGRIEEAVGQYKKALEIDPGIADAYRFMGTAYREKGEMDKALGAFQKALALQPDHDDAMHDLAVLEYQRGNVERSVRLLRRCLDLDPGNRQAMMNLAIGLLRLGRRAEAEEWMRRAKRGLKDET